jgi:hypothetical protein
MGTPHRLFPEQHDAQPRAGSGRGHSAATRSLHVGRRCFRHGAAALAALGWAVIDGVTAASNLGPAIAPKPARFYSCISIRIAEVATKPAQGQSDARALTMINEVDIR